MLSIYVDGDAFPNLLKPILLRSVERLKIQTIVVANKKIDIGQSQYVHYILVEAGADKADFKIAEMVQEGDLVITGDIPLADSVISKNAHAIDHRGELYSIDNIKQYLAMRNLMQTIRDSGEPTKGPAPFAQKNAHEFSNQLHQFLTKYC